MTNSLASVLLLVAVMPVIGQTQPPESPSYPFASYPADRLHIGKPAEPKLKTPTQREFRTVLRSGAKKGPNFAGHYTVVEWGCGSNCVVYAVVDALNGKIYERDMPPVNDQYPCGLLYKVESTLFVVKKSTTLGGACDAQLYRWNGSHFVPVQSLAP